MVGAGSAHGVAPLDDGLSPFHSRATANAVGRAAAHAHVDGASSPTVTPARRSATGSTCSDRSSPSPSTRWSGDDTPTAEPSADAGQRAVKRRRLVGPDVTRAVALIGVVVMNYHGYLNGADAARRAGFDVRSAAVRPVRRRAVDALRGDVHARRRRRRHAADARAVAPAATGPRSRPTGGGWCAAASLLYAGGFVLDWIWPGTILFFYGAALRAGRVRLHVAHAMADRHRQRRRAWPRPACTGGWSTAPSTATRSTG